MKRTTIQEVYSIINSGVAIEVTDCVPTEETHAARCLSAYLNSTTEIFNRYTIPAIEAVKKQIPIYERVKNLPPGYVLSGVSNSHPADIASAMAMTPIYEAIQLVKKHHGITPTHADIEAVKANYVDYIVRCATAD